MLINHFHSADDPTTQMSITWSTIDNPNGTTVEYGTKHVAEKIQDGNVTEFIDKGALRLKQYIHRVTLKGLTPGETYCESADLKTSLLSLFVIML